MNRPRSADVVSWVGTVGVVAALVVGIPLLGLGAAVPSAVHRVQLLLKSGDIEVLPWRLEQPPLIAGVERHTAVVLEEVAPSMLQRRLAGLAFLSVGLVGQAILVLCVRWGRSTPAQRCIRRMVVVVGMATCAGAALLMLAGPHWLLPGWDALFAAATDPRHPALRCALGSEELRLQLLKPSEVSGPCLFAIVVCGGQVIALLLAACLEARGGPSRAPAPIRADGALRTGAPVPPSPTSWR